MDERQLMEKMEASGAFKKGHFRLSSGLHSDTYIQCALLLSSPEAAVEIGRELAGRVDREIDLVACPALGGIIIGFAVALAMGVPMVFSERAEGKMCFRRGFGFQTGSKVLLVEDVVTTGASTMELAALVEDNGGSVEALGCIVSRGGYEPIGYPLFYLVRLDATAYRPEDCPLCAEGLPLEAPGSRHLRADP